MASPKEPRCIVHLLGVKIQVPKGVNFGTPLTPFEESQIELL